MSAYSQPQQSTDTSLALENIFARFANTQAQPQASAPAPQAPQLDPSFANAIEIFKQQQQAQQQPVYQPPPPVVQQPAPDLSSLLAQFAQQNQQQQQQVAVPDYQTNYGNDNERKRAFDDDSNQYDASRKNKKKVS